MSTNNPVKTNKPLDWYTTLNLSEEVKDLLIEIFRNSDGLHARGYIAMLVDPTANPMKAFGSTNPMPLTIVDGATPTNKANVSQPNVSMGTLGNALQVMALQYVYNSGTVNFLELVRTPNKWFNALISANGSTAIWTSAATKKARLMGWRATIVSGTTAAAACKLEILDVAADTGIGVQICGAALGAVPYSTIIANETFGPNGYLMAAANTAININLSSALAVAGVHVQVWGTEEP